MEVYNHANPEDELLATIEAKRVRACLWVLVGAFIVFAAFITFYITR